MDADMKEMKFTSLFEGVSIVTMRRVHQGVQFIDNNSSWWSNGNQCNLELCSGVKGLKASHAAKEMFCKVTLIMRCG